MGMTSLIATSADEGAMKATPDAGVTKVKYRRRQLEFSNPTPRLVRVNAPTRNVHVITWTRRVRAQLRREPPRAWKLELDAVDGQTTIFTLTFPSFAFYLTPFAITSSVLSRFLLVVHPQLHFLSLGCNRSLIRASQ